MLAQKCTAPPFSYPQPPPINRSRLSSSARGNQISRSIVPTISTASQIKHEVIDHKNLTGYYLSNSKVESNKLHNYSDKFYFCLLKSLCKMI